MTGGVNVATTINVTASGNGPLTADALRAVLASGVPGQAVVTVRVHDSQRDGLSWAVAAEWAGSPDALDGDR